MASPSAIAAALTAQAVPAQGAGQMQSFGAFAAASGAGTYNQWVAGQPMSTALPRSAADFLSGAFGPLNPLVPMPIDEPGEDGRPMPRRWQYPVGWNLPIGQPGSEGLKLASFAALRRYADIYSVVRSMLNIRKDEIAGTEWDIGPTADASSQTKGDKGAGKDQRARSKEMVAWFKNVDPDYYGFQSWFTSLLEELFVIDAVAIHLHGTRVPGKGLYGSSLAALAAINGETIRPLVDIRGSTPRPPEPAYQQYLYGVPRSDMMSVLTERDLDDMDDHLKDVGLDFDGDPEKTYRADQLLYLPRTRRVWTPYGFSAIEQAVVPITLGLNRQQFLLDFFMEGTIPGVYVIAGDAYVTPTQQRNLQDSLNALAGDVAWKHRVIVLPPGSKTDPQKDLTWAKDIDQTVIEQVAMILHIQPHEIGLVPGGRTSGLGGKGMAEEQASAVQKQRTMPELKWWKETVFDWVIQNVWGQKDMEWKWLGFEEEEDPAQAADVTQKYISVGARSIDEVRIDNGLDPWNLPLTQGPILISGNQVTPLDPSVQPPPPPAPVGGIGPDGKPLPGGLGNHPAANALGQSMMPEPGKNPDKPKNNPAAALLSDKKKDRKKARNELVDRFADNLKDATKPKNLPGGGADKGKDNFKKVTVADLKKWRLKYNDDKLGKIVHDYLLRSYPEKAVEWVKDGKWAYEPHVDLADINLARRPGGRDPSKVRSIAKTLDDGASMDPVVLVERPAAEGTGQYKYDIADGWHRLLGAEKAGIKDVKAFIGSGFSDPKDWGLEMQDESDSVKKVAYAELGTLRRFTKKGGKIENFRTAAIDSDILRQLPDKVAGVGLAPAFEWAYNVIAKSGGNPQALRDWYNAGADGQIDWGSEGDFMQCVDVASAYMDEEDAKGFCNLRHQDAVGGAPGTEKLIKYDDAESRDASGRWTAGSVDGPQVGDAPHYEDRSGDRVVHLDPVRLGSDGRTYAVHGLPPEQRIHEARRGAFSGWELGKNISLSSPLSTGLVPYDLAGQSRNCGRCGAELNGEGLCPVHGVAVAKFSPDQARDEHGMWTAEEGGTSVETSGSPGASALMALHRGVTANVKPEQVRSVMEAALKYKGDKPLRLEDIKVAGSRQFGQDGLGLRREQMPQVPLDQRDKYFEWLKGQGIGVEHEMVKPGSLQPSQRDISVTRVASMWKELQSPNLPDLDLLISKDNYVIDGHHRWGAETALAFEHPDATFGAYRVGMDAQPLIEATNKWDAQSGVSHRQLAARPDLAKAEAVDLLAAVEAELARRGIQPG